MDIPSNFKENLKQKLKDRFWMWKQQMKSRITKRFIFFFIPLMITIGVLQIHIMDSEGDNINHYQFAEYLLFYLAIFVAMRYVGKIEKANVLISIQQEELTKQHKIIEQKNREILDSITYATRIQSTILPPMRVVKKYLSDSFVLYLPKDIVAGDFYWMETTETDDLLFFAVCDCTGHGVPGAMVSVVCHHALNSAVREFGIRQPSQILNKSTELITRAFSLNNTEGDEIQDGMDASICALNTATGELEWSGANSPLWVVKLNGELIEYKADKQMVGRSQKLMPFTNHRITLDKGDTLYLFSDGYTDQFGGEHNKKFQRKALKELILSINSLSMDQQRESLFNTFEKWRGKNDQTDDVCMIGVRI